MTLTKALLAISATAASAAIDGVHVDQATSTWRDADGRSLLWHGINFVKKSSPFYPTIDDETIDKMNSMGLTAVRLGVMMGGIYPNSSEPDMDYLATIEVRSSCSHPTVL